MITRADLLERLPHTFRRMEAKKLTFELGRSRSWLNQQIDDLMFEGKIQRIERGVYQKLQ